uniref:Uncharacterized protein n=1 Tax=Avena sativa TaxID=4498 RepID=A0ACD5ZNT8_AVESA
MFFSLLQVAGILVHLARLTLLKITRDIKLNNDLSPSHLVKAKQLVNDSIRITEGILNPLRENQKKLKSTIGVEREKIGATAVLSDYEQAEQALRKCISLYNEPRTRSVVSKYLRQQYARCLSSLMLIIQHDPDISNTPRMQDLLGEAQQIMKELGEEKNMK